MPPDTKTDLAIYGSVGSLLSTTLTRTCDAVVNLPVLKDHGIVGVTMALKNLFGAIHNPNKLPPSPPAIPTSPMSTCCRPSARR